MPSDAKIINEKYDFNKTQEKPKAQHKHVRSSMKTAGPHTTQMHKTLEKPSMLANAHDHYKELLTCIGLSLT